jgi:hypothetical protein
MSTAVLSAQTAVPSDSTFGSSNDGLDGFTADATLASAWSVESDGALFTNLGDTDNGQVNSSLLKDFAVDPFFGAQGYTFSATVDWISGDSVNNNRLGLGLFAETGDAAGATGTGLSLQYNVGDGNILITNAGVNGPPVSTVDSYGGRLIGDGVFVFDGEVLFDGNDANVTFTLTDPDGYEQSVSATVFRFDLIGNFFGTSSRARVRNPGDPEFIYEVQEFSVAEVVPEPSSYGLILGAFSLASLGLRRRRSA